MAIDVTDTHRVGDGLGPIRLSVVYKYRYASNSAAMPRPRNEPTEFEPYRPAWLILSPRKHLFSNRLSDH
jgi:hypothetical protein